MTSPPSTSATACGTRRFSAAMASSTTAASSRMKKSTSRIGRLF